MQWDHPRTGYFCEAKYLNGKPFESLDEFTNGLSSFFLLSIGAVGLFQPGAKLITKMMYSCIALSGVGSVMLHWKRIEAYNLIDIFPLLLGLTLAMISAFDELIQRRKIYNFVLTTQSNISVSSQLSEESSNVSNVKFCYNIATSFMVLVLHAYFILGLIFIVYKPFDTIFGYYFGIPYSLGHVLACGYLFYRDISILPREVKQVVYMGLICAVLAILFKVIDSFICNSVTLWIFPHSLWHLFIALNAHCGIIFLSYVRSDLEYPFTRKNNKVVWVFKVFPYLNSNLDDYSHCQSRSSSIHSCTTIV